MAKEDTVEFQINNEVYVHPRKAHAQLAMYIETVYKARGIKPKKNVIITNSM